MEEIWPDQFICKVCERPIQDRRPVRIAYCCGVEYWLPQMESRRLFDAVASGVMDGFPESAMRPTATLICPDMLTDEQAAELKKAWELAYSGKPGVIERIKEFATGRR